MLKYTREKNPFVTVTYSAVEPRSHEKDHCHPLRPLQENCVPHSGPLHCCFSWSAQETPCTHTAQLWKLCTCSKLVFNTAERCSAASQSVKSIPGSWLLPNRTSLCSFWIVQWKVYSFFSLKICLKWVKFQMTPVTLSSGTIRYKLRDRKSTLLIPFSMLCQGNYALHKREVLYIHRRRTRPKLQTI